MLYSHYGQTSPTCNVVRLQSREVNEDDEEDDEGFRDAEEIMETAMSLKERRHEYRRLLGATSGISFIVTHSGCHQNSHNIGKEQYQEEESLTLHVG